MVKILLDSRITAMLSDVINIQLRAPLLMQIYTCRSWVWISIDDFVNNILRDVCV
jgi:hypothetical protein